MVLVATFAQRILDENGYTRADISLSNLENNIDNVIDYVNLMAGTTIADLAGAADSKSITATESELVAVRAGANLWLRAYMDKGTQTSVSGITITHAVDNPNYRVFTMVLEAAITRLKMKEGVPFIVEEDTTGYE